MMKIFKIADIAEIHSGYQVRERSELGKIGNISFIQVKDIDRDLNKVQLDNLEKLNMDKDMNKYRAQKDDVLFLAKGNISACLLDEETFSAEEIYIPMSHFFILRPNNDLVLKGFLKWILNHKDTQVKLKRLLKGTMMAFISRPDFENFELTLPSLEKQKFIVELVELREKEKLLIRKLESEKDKLYDAALNELINRKGEIDTVNFMEELKKI